MSDEIQIFEVGPRDGLQNEKRSISLEQKIFLIQGLADAGLKEIEIGAFVRPDRVPQMADTDSLVKKFTSARKWNPWVLVPNRKGLELARKSGAKSIAVFTAATESFNQRNIGMSLRESLNEIAEIVCEARGYGMSIRGYVSTAFGCPFEGKTKPLKAIQAVNRLLALGIDQVSIGDTIGVATPRDVDAVFKPLLRGLRGKDRRRMAAHFHDTRGTALLNSFRAMELGVTTIDASVGGLGGCPFAPGATGNLATEDLAFCLQGQGIKTKINLARLSDLSLEFSRRIGRPLTSRYLQAFAAQKQGPAARA